jgi:hypothetical protein
MDKHLVCALELKPELQKCGLEYKLAKCGRCSLVVPLILLREPQQPLVPPHLLLPKAKRSLATRTCVLGWLIAGGVSYAYAH